MALLGKPCPCERSGGGGGWEDISEQFLTLLLTFGLPQWRHLICLSLPACSIDRHFQYLQSSVCTWKKKDCIFHKLPCCLGNYLSHMLRSFLRQMPRCSQRDTANMTDGQHRDRTDQDMCLGSTQKCLCAHKYRIDDARSVSCKVCKCLERGPLKMCPRWINTGRWQFLSPSHILEGRCCELHWLCHSHYLPEIHSYMHPRRYIYKVINIFLHAPTCTCTPHIYICFYLSCLLEIIINLVIIHYYSIRITSANKHSRYNCPEVSWYDVH